MMCPVTETNRIPTKRNQQTGTKAKITTQSLLEAGVLGTLSMCSESGLVPSNFSALKTEKTVLSSAWPK